MTGTARSVAAVLLGLIAVVALSLATDQVLLEAMTQMDEAAPKDEPPSTPRGIALAPFAPALRGEVTLGLLRRAAPLVGHERRAAAELLGHEAEGREASADEVQAALQRVGWRRIHLDARRREASLERPGMGLDPGAIGKGYALDAAARVLRAR